MSDRERFIEIYKKAEADRTEEEVETANMPVFRATMNLEERIGKMASACDDYVEAITKLEKMLVFAAHESALWRSYQAMKKTTEAIGDMYQEALMREFNFYWDNKPRE